jgi:hypothetical protein
MKRKKILIEFLAILTTLSVSVSVFGGCNNSANTDGDNQTSVEQPDGDNQTNTEQPDSGNEDGEIGTDVTFLGMKAGGSVASLSASATKTVVQASAQVAAASSSNEVYSQYRDENFYIDVKFDNQNNYKIKEFTISYAGQKTSYKSNRFEEGSTSSDIYVQIPATYYNAEYTEYVISNITYVSDTAIKKVNIDSNDSLLVGVKDIRGNKIETEIFVENDDGYCMSGISEEYIKDGVLTVPSEYKGKPVTSIGMYAFVYSDIKKVIIPDTIETIDYGAFYGCKSLEKVELGSGIIKIGCRAFYNCKNINYVNYTGTLSSWCRILFGDEIVSETSAKENKLYKYTNPTFFANDLHINGELVTEVVIPEDITDVLQYAFVRCMSITSVNLNGNVATIGDYAFNTCASLTSVNLDGVVEIGAAAFGGCYNLASITIPSSVREIKGIGDNEAFHVTQKLVEVYNLSSLEIVKGSSNNGAVALYADNVYSDKNTVNISQDEDGFLWYEKVGESDKIYLVGYNGTESEITVPSRYNDKQVEISKCAFAGNRVVEKVTFEDGFTSIPARAFAYCRSIREVVVPSTVTAVYDHAFWMSSIKKIELPASCKFIGNSAFAKCSNLEITINARDVVFDEIAFESCTNLTVNFAGSVNEWAQAAEDDFFGSSNSYKGVLSYIEVYTINCVG